MAMQSGAFGYVRGTHRYTDIQGSWWPGSGNWEYVRVCSRVWYLYLGL